MYQILPAQLYQRGMTHKIEASVKASGLREHGITHSVALAPGYPDPDLVGFNQSGHHRYTHMPIPDGKLDPSDAAQLLLLAIELASEIENGGRVMTMCRAGRNRSGLLSALIVRQLGTIPGAAALELVQTERPNSLFNPYFNDFLRGLS